MMHLSRVEAGVKCRLPAVVAFRAPKTISSVITPDKPCTKSVDPFPAHCQYSLALPLSLRACLLDAVAAVGLRPEP